MWGSSVDGASRGEDTGGEPSRPRRLFGRGAGKCRLVSDAQRSFLKGGHSWRRLESPGKAALAIDGGPKAFAAIEGRRRPKIGVAEFLAIARRFGFSPDTLVRLEAIVSDDELGRGPTLARYATAYPTPSAGEVFEQVARETFAVQYALGVSSGTAALHSALAAAGVGPGTEVILPAIGFFATAAAVVAARGVPVFCDVDESLHMDPAKIEARITPRTAALVPTCVMGGVPALEPILDVARRHELKVIEDCAQSPGAKYRGRHVGTWGDLGCFSISAYKIVGGGEGRTVAQQRPAPVRAGVPVG